MRLKRSEKYALWAGAIGILVGIPLVVATGGLGLIIAPIFAAGAYKGMLDLRAKERAVDGELLDK